MRSVSTAGLGVRPNGCAPGPEVWGGEIHAAVVKDGGKEGYTTIGDKGAEIFGEQGEEVHASVGIAPVEGDADNHNAEEIPFDVYRNFFKSALPAAPESATQSALPDRPGPKMLDKVRFLALEGRASGSSTKSCDTVSGFLMATLSRTGSTAGNLNSVSGLMSVSTGSTAANLNSVSGFGPGRSGSADWVAD